VKVTISRAKVRLAAVIAAQAWLASLQRPNAVLDH
jgi:hypothetical protein